MPAPLVLPPVRGWSARRWIIAAAIVALAHAGIAYWMSRRVDAPDAAGLPEAVVMIELPPAAVAEPTPLTEAAPGPQMKEAAPEPEAAPPPPPPELEQIQPEELPAPELPPEPKPDAVLIAPATPAPKPKVEPKPKAPRQPIDKEKIEKEKIEKEREKAAIKQEVGPRAPRTTAPRQSAGAPGPAAAQARRGSAGSAASASAWQAAVSAQVNRNTRYPPSARGTTGAASVSFSIDRSGRLVSAGVARSSGSALLDGEAVATVRRASPFPPPPAEVPGGRFAFTKTINFRN